MIDPTDLDVALQTIRESLSQSHYLYAMLAGTATFGSTLALSTLIQQQILHVSTATRPPVPTLLGVATVCVASVASHQAALLTQEYLRWGTRPNPKFWESNRRNPNARFGYRQDYLDVSIPHVLPNLHIPLHTLRICCFGLLTFSLLGGRFWAIAPSTYTHLGSFARPSFSMPATANYASKLQRLQLERMGRLAGCHTCGSRMMLFKGGSFKFVGDVSGIVKLVFGVYR
jgi:hypothetical protein